MDARAAVDRPFGAPITDIELDLPPPPSVNKTRRIDRAGQRVTAKWHKAADELVTIAWSGGRRPKNILAQFEVVIVLDERRVRIDLDNGIKSLIDYARRLGLIVNDDKRYLRELRVVWGDAPHGCRLILRPREPN